MKRLIHWFVENPVAANLCMLLILVGGLSSISSIPKEFFPAAPANTIRIIIPYLGAGPKEVEQQICTRVEEAVYDLNGIDELHSTARQGMAQIDIEVEVDYDADQLMNEVKTRVDALNTLPPNAERPRISKIINQHPLLNIALSGDVSETALKHYGEIIRREMAELDDVALVELSGTRLYEVSIELSEQTLRRYQLSFDEVAQAIANNSIDLPAGSIKADTGDILLQTRGQAYHAEDFANIIVRQGNDGAALYLKDIATIKDGFEEQDGIARFNGQQAVFMAVKAPSKPDVLATSQAVKNYIKARNPTLPAGMQLTLWLDSSFSFKGRIETLISNGLSGLLLVFIVLMLFLRPLIAIWVSVGIAISFMGTFWLLPLTGISLNMLSLFAFLLILGIIVDDAIIAGESIYTRQQSGIRGAQAASSGAQMVAKPIFFAVISTMIVFVPMFFLPGDSANTAKAIPVVVILTLAFSLFESLCILPSHLSHMKPEKPATSTPGKALQSLRKSLSDNMERFIKYKYEPLLTFCLNWHVATLASFILLLGVSISLLSSGWLRTSFLPEVSSDYLIAKATLNEGSPFSNSELALKHMQDAALELRQSQGYTNEDGVFQPFISNTQAWAYGNQVTVILEVSRNNRHLIDNQALSEAWSKSIKPIPLLEDLSIKYTLNDSGKALQFELASANKEQLNAASAALQKYLGDFQGVYDISNSMQTPRPEIELSLRDNAQQLGLTLAELGRQIRQGFYGQEVQRIPRDQEAVRVMVRYVKEERNSLSQLDDIYIRSKDGQSLPFRSVAEVNYVDSYRQIKRSNRKRVITIKADVFKDSGDAALITKTVSQEFRQILQERYPDVKMRLKGEQQERQEFTAALISGSLLAFIVIYMIFAVIFHSYWQPLIILTAVPFGFMGAVFGHMLLGMALSIFSFLGILACAGVVVNDNLVLIDRINQLRNQHNIGLKESLIQAGHDRFRAIILTSITTFIGLIPIMLETSLQAQFLIPMVVALAFGVLFATTITLVLVPCLFYLGERSRQIFGRNPQTE